MSLFLDHLQIKNMQTYLSGGAFYTDFYCENNILFVFTTFYNSF